MAASKVPKVVIIGWSMTVLLTAIFLLIPEAGIYTRDVKLFFSITVFALSAAAFELLPDIATALLLPALYMLFKVAPANVVFAPWVGTTMIMIFGAFFMAATLERCGLLRRIAFWMMCKAKGNYFVLLFAIMCAGVVINILTSGRGYLIMGALGAGLCMSLDGMQKKVGAGIAAAVMLGGCTSHAYTYQSSMWSVIMKMSEGYIGPTDITPLSVTLHNWPLFFVSIVILFVVSKMYKPEKDLGQVDFFQEQLKAMGKITRREKMNALMLGVLLLYIFTVSIHKMDINLGFAIIPLMVLLPGIDGADRDVWKEINFPIGLFIAGCMAIGTVATHLGLGVVLMEATQGLLGANSSPIPLMAVVFGIVFALNFLMTPMAILSIFIQPMCMLAVDMGHSAIPFAYAINACSEAVLLPYEYVPYLVVYSFGMMRMKDFIAYNVVRSVLFFTGFLLVLVPYWMLIGLL